MTQTLRLASLALVLAALTACATSKPKGGDPASTAVAPASAATEPAAVATPLSPDGVARAGVATEPNEGKVDLPPELASRRVVYFAYDSDTLAPAELELVAAHAKFLTANPRIRLRLEGHTDERGTREYNIGLGERRAQAVRRAMALQGVVDGNLATVSYGEEQPAVTGSDDASLARNRRVELVYVAP
ncbi:MAG: peptidoglycan-associated lipoprotein Pal [Gammaproteobacteria bacterium]